MATLLRDRAVGIDLGVLSDLAGYHLRRASGAFAADFARALSGTGMRQVLFGILSVVAANPGITQGVVGRHLGIQRANMVSLITELVDQELIERRVSKGDRRAFALELSAAGGAKLEECIRRIRIHEEEMLADFDVADRRALTALLMRIETRDRG